MTVEQLRADLAECEEDLAQVNEMIATLESDDIPDDQQDQELRELREDLASIDFQIRTIHEQFAVEAAAPAETSSPAAEDARVDETPEPTVPAPETDAFCSEEPQSSLDSSIPEEEEEVCIAESLPEPERDDNVLQDQPPVDAAEDEYGIALEQVELYVCEGLDLESACGRVCESAGGSIDQDELFQRALQRGIPELTAEEAREAAVDEAFQLVQRGVDIEDACRQVVSNPASPITDATELRRQLQERLDAPPPWGAGHAQRRQELEDAGAESARQEAELMREAELEQAGQAGTGVYRFGFAITNYLGENLDGYTLSWTVQDNETGRGSGSTVCGEGLCRAPNTHVLTPGNCDVVLTASGNVPGNRRRINGTLEVVLPEPEERGETEVRVTASQARDDQSITDVDEVSARRQLATMIGAELSASIPVIDVGVSGTVERSSESEQRERQMQTRAWTFRVPRTTWNESRGA